MFVGWQILNLLCKPVHVRSSKIIFTTLHPSEVHRIENEILNSINFIGNIIRNQVNCRNSKSQTRIAAKEELSQMLVRYKNVANPFSSQTIKRRRESNHFCISHKKKIVRTWLFTRILRGHSTVIQGCVHAGHKGVARHVGESERRNFRSILGRAKTPVLCKSR